MFTPEQIADIKASICVGATDNELSLFMSTCKRLRLDPFARQIYAVKRYDGKQKREVMAIQVSIDGFRLAAERTGEYRGQLGPFWCGDDGKWVDVWLKDGPPKAARIAVLRSSFDEPLWSVANFSEYVQTTKDGNPTGMWRRMPALMVAKCCEALALRRAFPNELSGIYSPDEMGQADNPEPEQRASTEALQVMEVEHQILTAETRAELDALAPRIGRMSEEAKQILRPIWRDRWAAINGDDQ